MIIAWRTFPYAAKAIARKVWRILRRKPLFISEDEQEARKQICTTCEHRFINDANSPDADQCDICTCNIALKVMWCDEFCPLNPPKWS